MRSKGVEGHIMVIIISIIIAILVLAMIWYFINKSSKIVEEGGKNAFTKLRCFICEKLGWRRIIWKVTVGDFCGGCI